MPSNSSLCDKAEALRELKAQYYVGSQSAFRYLKTMDWYEKVRDEVMQDPAVQGKYKPTVREIARLIPAVRTVVERWLNLLAVKASTPEDLSLVTEHHLVVPFEIESAVDKERRECQLQDSAGTSVYQWKFDDVLFLQELSSLAFCGLCAEFAISNVILLFEISLLAKGDPPKRKFQFLTSAESSEKVSFSQFSAEPKFRRGDLVQFRQLVEDYLYLAPAPYDSLSKRFVRQIAAVETLSPVEISPLRKAFDMGDLAGCHYYIQPHQVRRTERDFVEVMKYHCRQISAGIVEAEDWLYCSDLYGRAEREHVLGCIDVERRIVLNYMRLFRFTAGDDFVSASALVDAAVRHAARQVAKAFEYARGGSDEFGRAELRYAQYVYVALRKNRPWLIELFSR